MTHDEFLNLLSARVDGELTPEQHEQLEAYLRENADARVLREAFESQDAELRRAFEPRRQAATAVAERTARELPVVANNPAMPSRVWRRRLLWAIPSLTAAAAIIAAVFFLSPRDRQIAPQPVAAGTSPADAGLKPRELAAAPKPQELAPGQSLVTKAGERKRVRLDDGSVLYLNQNTTLAVTEHRHLKLSSGELFAEVAPIGQAERDRFVIETPQRTVTALGTKFAVRAEDSGTGVLVTQGKVQVTGLGEPVKAGQQLPPGEKNLSTAPRASHALDWAQGLMASAESPLVPAGKYDGGALIAVDPYGQEAKLSLVKYHVDVHIEDGFARTTIDQTYFNSENFQMEGTFYFPLPPDASLSRLAMYVDGNLMEGGMAERDYARQTYERIRFTRRDPALLEWVDGSLFKMRVFPLEARQQKRILLSYTQRLPALYGETTYRFPAGHSLNVVNEWSFSGIVKGGAGLTFRSPSHPDIKATTQGSDLVLTDSATPARVDRDVVVELTDPAQPAVNGEQVRWSSMKHDGSRYLMLRYRPELQGEPQRERRDWVFLFESSGARDPLLARTQIEVIRALLANAEHDDTFSILTVGTRVKHFRAEPVMATPSNIKEAIAFLEQSHLIGALNLEQGLIESARDIGVSPNTYLVHVGSGIASLGEQRSEALIPMIPQGTRYVGVAVGKRYSLPFMKGAAEKTGGYFTQINPDEPVSWRGFELAATLNTPRLLNVALTVPAKAGVEAVRFLPFGNVVCQGEEFAAVAKVGDDPASDPTSVTVTGMLNGSPFERTIPVADVHDGAGYLPRTWAKLELDRLLAQDSVKNKPAIIELSKAMYVMTPYTSLLVLENEQMYRDFKVDRGRKDHWAMYPAPQKIPVVYIPDPNQPANGRGPVTGQKPHENQVMQTVLCRNAPSFLTSPDGNQNQEVTKTSGQYFGKTFALWDADGVVDSLGDGQGKPVRVEEVRILGNDVMRAWNVTRLGRGIHGPLSTGGVAGLGFSSGEMDEYASIVTDFRERPTSSLVLGDFEEHRLAESLGAVGLTRNKQLMLAYENTVTDGRRSKLRGDNWQVLGLTPAGNSTPDLDIPIRSFSADGSVRFLSVNGGDSMTFGTRLLYENAEPAPLLLPAVDAPNRPVAVPPPANRIEAILTDRTTGPRYYSRPSFTGAERVFTDLTAYAPGMNSSIADVRAVVEAEAAPRFGARRGSIDPEARKLIEAARTTEWYTALLPSGGAGPLAVVHDYTGRYTYERKLPLGLTERVICDGTTLLHLYPELGIGARRQMTRFHRAEFAVLCPDVLPPADDLAFGADVKLIDQQTIAIVPLRLSEKADAAEPTAWVEEHLIFDRSRFAERRWLLVQKDKDKPKLLGREVYGLVNSVQRFDGDGKEIKFKEPRVQQNAATPDLKPDLHDLVVLPLPFRSRHIVYESLEMDPNVGLNDGVNGCYPYFDEESALKLLAVHFAENQPPQVLDVWLHCFAEKGDRRIGFYTLLVSCGASPAQNSPFKELLPHDPANPLLNYLTLLQNSTFNSRQARFGLLPGPDMPDTFIGRLANFRWLTLRWRSDLVSDDWFGYRPHEQDRALAFVRQNAGNVLGWCALTFLEDRARDDKEFQRRIAGAWGLVAEKSALKYPARYEQARCLARAEEAAKARDTFEKLFVETFEKGVLPPTDDAFRSALSHKEAPGMWAKLMRNLADACAEKKGQRPVIVAIAWQCRQLGDQPLADALLDLALSKFAGDDERIETTLAAVEYLCNIGETDQADRLINGLLTMEKLSKAPLIWRVAAHIAERRGKTVRSIECLEKALDLEFSHLPEVVNLESIRADYGKLMSHYQWLASAVQALHVQVPDDLMSRTVRAADRWRMLDAESSGVCDQAATILRQVGGTQGEELAWDYLTTPLATKPNDSGPWMSLASTLSREGQNDLADRCFDAAFRAEPTNAQILWDRAQQLQRIGKVAESRTQLQRLANGDWQPRFDWIQSQAKRIIEGR